MEQNYIKHEQSTARVCTKLYVCGKLCSNIHHWYVILFSLVSAPSALENEVRMGNTFSGFTVIKYSLYNVLEGKHFKVLWCLYQLQVVEKCPWFDWIKFIPLIECQKSS